MVFQVHQALRDLKEFPDAPDQMDSQEVWVKPGFLESRARRGMMGHQGELAFQGLHQRFVTVDHVVPRAPLASKGPEDLQVSWGRRGALDSRVLQVMVLEEIPVNQVLRVSLGTQDLQDQRVLMEVQVCQGSMGLKVSQGS